jgi:hypothetical protein
MVPSDHSSAVSARQRITSLKRKLLDRWVEHGTHGTITAQRLRRVDRTRDIHRAAFAETHVPSSTAARAPQLGDLARVICGAGEAAIEAGDEGGRVEVFADEDELAVPWLVLCPWLAEGPLDLGGRDVMEGGRDVVEGGRDVVRVGVTW